MNMSNDMEQEFFSDGISEEILNSLAKVTDLKVAGRTSSFSFKGKNEDLSAIGKVFYGPDFLWLQRVAQLGRRQIWCFLANEPGLI